MKKLAWIMSLLTLVSFVWLTGVESFHHHKDAQAESHCMVCQISHQARAPIQAAQISHSDILLGNAALLVLAQPALQFVLPSHGLSPPAL